MHRNGGNLLMSVSGRKSAASYKNGPLAPAMLLCAGTLLLGSLLLAACASTAAERGGGGQRDRNAQPERDPAARAKALKQMHALHELPPRHRAVWEAWIDRDPVWEGIRAEVLEDPQLTEFLVDNLMRYLLRSYRAAAFTPLESFAGKKGEKRKLGSFDRTRSELIILGDHSAPYLAEFMSIGASDVANLASGILKDIGRSAVLPVSKQLELPQEGAQRRSLHRERDARMRAARLLGQLPRAGKDEAAVLAGLIRCLANDPEWIVRSQAAESLGRRGGRDVQTEDCRRALSMALADEDPSVVIKACLGLAFLGDVASVPALINHLDRSQRDGDVRGVSASQQALVYLTKVNNLQADTRWWRDWWRENRSHLLHD